MIEELLKSLVTSHPVLLSFVSTVGVLRLILRPLMEAIDLFVASTETKQDDEVWAAIKASKAFKVFIWGLEYLTSLRLPRRV